MRACTRKRLTRSRLMRIASAGYAKEAQGFGKLLATPESQALRSIFFATTALKKNRFGEPSRRVNTVAVMGAGLMGAGIAQVSAQKGMRVLLKDRDVKGLSRGEKQIVDNLVRAERGTVIRGLWRDARAPSLL